MLRLLAVFLILFFDLVSRYGLEEHIHEFCAIFIMPMVGVNLSRRDIVIAFSYIEAGGTRDFINTPRWRYRFSLLRRGAGDVLI